MKPNVFALAALLFLVTIFSGCAGMERFETGIPASSASNFLFFMDKEALDRGYTSDLQGDQRLAVIIDGQGSLDYSVLGDGVVVTVQVEDPYDVAEHDMQDRIDALRTVSDDMIDGAVERATKAKVFE